MAEFQWWLLIVGLVAGGGLVAVLYMDARRRDVDVDDEELRAESSWIAGRLAGRPRSPDAGTIESVLRAHREYLALPPPDRLEAAAPPEGATERQPEGGDEGSGRRSDAGLPPA